MRRASSIMRPEVNVVAVDVRAPGDDQLRAMKLLGVGAELAAVDGEDGVAAGGGADGAVELGGAEPMEEAAVHGAVAEHADGAGVAVGQDGFGAVLLGDGREPMRRSASSASSQEMRSKLSASLPGGQWTLGDAGAAAHGIEQPIGRVDAIEIAGDLAAEETAGDRVAGSPATFCARPSASTLTSTAQESGQSCEQTAWTTRSGDSVVACGRT